MRIISAVLLLLGITLAAFTFNAASVQAAHKLKMKPCMANWGTYTVPYSNAYLKDVTNKKEWRKSKVRRFEVAFASEVGLPATHMVPIVVKAKTQKVYVNSVEIPRPVGMEITCGTVYTL